MTTWRYRVMREWDEATEFELLTIVEAHTPDGATEPTSWGPAFVSSDEGFDGLRWTLARMLVALDDPVWDQPFEPENPDRSVPE